MYIKSEAMITVVTDYHGFKGTPKPCITQLVTAWIWIYNRSLLDTKWSIFAIYSGVMAKNPFLHSSR